MRGAGRPHPIIGQDKAKRIIRAAFDRGDAVLLEGHTGCGKTGIIEEVAYDMGQKFVRLNLNGQTGVDEFVGRWLIRDGATYWVDGLLTLAMRHGWVMLCDEINAALPEICFVLQTVLDDARYLRLAEKDGEVVHAHPDFRFAAAMNPPDEYAGTKELNHSLRSRFKAKVVMHYPDPVDERNILESRAGIMPAVAAIMVEFATRARNAKAAGLCFMPVGTRDLLAWAEYTGPLGREVAFEVSILNNSGPDAKFFSDQLAAADKEWKAFAAKHGARKVETLLSDIEKKIEAMKTAEADAEELIRKAAARAAETLKDADVKRRGLEVELANLRGSIAAEAAARAESVGAEVTRLIAARIAAGPAPEQPVSVVHAVDSIAALTAEANGVAP